MDCDGLRLPQRRMDGTARRHRHNYRLLSQRSGCQSFRQDVPEGRSRDGYRRFLPVYHAMVPGVANNQILAAMARGHPRRNCARAYRSTLTAYVTLRCSPRGRPVELADVDYPRVRGSKASTINLSHLIADKTRLISCRCVSERSAFGKTELTCTAVTLAARSVWRSIFFGILMWSVFIYAFRRGGWEEKLTLASVTIRLIIGAASEPECTPFSTDRDPACLC